MGFCDMRCKHATWPEEGTDGSGSCRTFQAIYCLKKKQLVHKNQVCKDWEEAEEKKPSDGRPPGS